jgi:hypothetical protein
MNEPGVWAGFEHNSVDRVQVSLCPALKPGQRYPAGVKNHLLLAIYGTNHDVALVDIESDEALNLN